MSNFFQQLIARQQGSAQTVQPLISSRFAPSASAEPEGDFWGAVLANGDSPPMSLRVSSPELISQPSMNDNRAERPLSMPAVPAMTSPQDTSARIEALTHWIGEMAAFGNRASSKQTVLEQNLNSAAENPLPESSVSGSEWNHTPAIDSQRSSDQTLPTMDSNPQGLWETSVRSPLLKDTAETATADLSALGNLHHRPPLPTSLQPMLQSPPLQLPPPAPIPTVQIAIGRIEIRATTSAAAPRPRPVHKPALSLDHYLQQRSRRS